MSIRARLLILSGIFFLALFLRFYHLGINPVGFHRDEAFLAYNAYSILKTGKDMSGNRLPIHLQSFFYSPAGYSYASIPFIAIFGLNEFSARFASALFGSLSVMLTYFLVKLLIDSEPSANQIALLSSFTIAVSPWHINASRIGIEITLVVFLIISGIILFLRYTKSKHLFLLVSSFILFALTFTVYQAPRAFVPFIIPILLFLYRKYIAKKHWLIAGILYAFCIVFPLLLILRSPELSLRIQSLSVFKAPLTQLKTDESIREDGMSQSPVLFTRILHNKAIGYSNEIINNYMAHFSFDFLFRDKAFPTRMVIFGSGNLYSIELLFLLTGLYMIATRRKQYHLLLAFWILLSPLGSSLTYDDVPNMQRTLLIQPALSIVLAMGIYYFFEKIRTVKSYVFLVLISGIYIFNITQYIDAYYIHQPIRSAQFRNAGYKELVFAVTKLLPQYQKAVITNAESAPSVFFLFFTSYDPTTYQKESIAVDKNKSDSINFSSYNFEGTDCPLNDRLGFKKGQPYTPIQLPEIDKHTVFVQYRGCDIVTQTTELLQIIKQPNGQEVFQLVKIK